MLHPALIVWWFAAGCSAADDGDDFANNLFNDLAPLLALFGERVTMQFMSQSMGWADNLILAMGPIGIMTIIVSAIRVGGPNWMKVLVGRAKENLAAAEMELLSSTSKEVCELWNGSEVVRCMGKCPLTEFIILVPNKGVNKDSHVIVREKWETYLEEAKQKTVVTQTSPGKTSVKSSSDEEKGQPKNGNPEPEVKPPPVHDNNGTENQATKDEQNSDEDNNIIVIRINDKKVENVPNISLNCYKLSSSRKLWIFAIIGTILQLGVVAYWGFATYYRTLRFPKGGKEVVKYAYPCAAVGTLALVLGMMLCSHVVESRTKERKYVPRGKAHDVYFCWLQQEKIVNDQSFNSHIIYCEKKNKYIVMSWRDGEESRLKTLTFFSSLIALAGFIVQFVGLRGLHWSASVTQLGMVGFMLACKAVVRRGLSRPPQSSDSLKSGFELEWLTKVLCEPSEPHQNPLLDLSRDLAVEPPQSSSQDSSQGPAQDLALDLALKWMKEQIEELRVSRPQGSDSFIRSVRRVWAFIRMSFLRFLRFLNAFFSDAGDAKRPNNRGLVHRFVGWFIKKLHRKYGTGAVLQWFKDGMSSSPATDNKGVADKPAQIPDWMINNFGEPGLRIAEAAMGSPAHSMMIVRRDLGRLAEWPERPSKAAIAVTKSIEIAMNTLFLKDVEGTANPTYWSIKKSKDQVIDFKIEYKNGKYTLDFMEMDAILSLWLFADSQQYSEDESKRSGEDGKTDFWLRSKGLLPDSALCLLGPYSDALHRDIWWWMPTKENPIFLVQKCESANTDYDSLENLRERYGRVVGSVSEYEWIEKPETRLSIRQLEEPTFDEEGAKPEVFFATEKRTSVELVYAQHIFSAFISAVAADKPIHINPSKTTLRTEVTTNGDAWRSFTVANETLSRMALEIQQTGLGSLEEIYQSILPPLSLSNKLPQPDGLIELARKDARVHEKAGQWGEAGRIYFSLMRRIKTYPSDAAIAIKAGATIMQFWRQVVFAIKTEMAEDAALKGLGEKLGTQLKDINEETFRDLKRLYITQNRGRAWENDLNHIKVVGLESFRKEYGITESHKLAISTNQAYVLSKRYNPDLDLKSADVFGWTPLHYVSTQGQPLVGEPFVPRIIEQVAKRTGINARDLIEWTPLHYACSTGEIGMVQTIIRFGADVNVQGRDNFTPLHCAAYHGHKAIVAALIEAGANVNLQDVFGNSPLFWAIRERHEPVCRLLYESRDLNKRLRNFNVMTALHQAAGFGDQAIVELLLHDKDAIAKQDVNANDRALQTPLHLAAKHGQEEAVIELLLKNDANIEAKASRDRTPLHLAVEARHEAVVKLLLDKGADTKAQGSMGATLLHLAAEAGLEAVVKLLVDKDANIKAQDSLDRTPVHTAAEAGHTAVVELLITKIANIEVKGNANRTPLHEAADAGREAVVKMLLDKGADFKAQTDDKWTPLHMAAMHGHEAVVKLLLEKGPDIEARDKAGGRTPLHIGAEFLEGQAAIIKLLLEKGADLTAETKQGETPLNIAERLRKDAIVRLLLDHAQMYKREKRP